MILNWTLQQHSPLLLNFRRKTSAMTQLLNPGQVTLSYAPSELEWLLSNAFSPLAPPPMISSIFSKILKASSKTYQVKWLWNSFTISLTPSTTIMASRKMTLASIQFDLICHGHVSQLHPSLHNHASRLLVKQCLSLLYPQTCHWV